MEPRLNSLSSDETPCVYISMRMTASATIQDGA